MLSRKNRQWTTSSDQLQFVMSAVVDATTATLVMFYLLCVATIAIARVGWLKAMLTNQRPLALLNMFRLSSAALSKK